MAHGFIEEFVVQDVTHVQIPEHVPLGSTKFDVFTKVGNVGVHLTFRWDGLKGYYYCDVLTDKGVNHRIWPRLRLAEEFRGFDPLDTTNRDAVLLFASTDQNDRGDITPDTLGSKHLLYFAMGRFE